MIESIEPSSWTLFEILFTPLRTWLFGPFLLIFTSCLAKWCPLPSPQNSPVVKVHPGSWRQLSLNSHKIINPLIKLLGGSAVALKTLLLYQLKEEKCPQTFQFLGHCEKRTVDNVFGFLGGKEWWFIWIAYSVLGNVLPAFYPWSHSILIPALWVRRCY